MPHDYPLHTEVRVPCLCCGSAQPFVFASPSDQVVCAHCRGHLGDEKAVRRDREHVTLWAGLLDHAQQEQRADATAAASAAAEAAASIAGLESRVVELSAGLVADYEAGAGAPNGEKSGVRAQLEGELLSRAERRTELAERRGDRAFAALWQLRRRHDADSAHPGRCLCGRSVVECPEFGVLEGQAAALAEWEARNLELARAGRRHALPPGHPGLA